MLAPATLALALASLLAAAPDAAHAGAARDACASVDSLVAATYGFQPHRLTAAEVEARSAGMDRFWEAVKANPAATLPCLRAALDRGASDPFFRFDGTNLLVSLDSTPEAKRRQVEAYAAVDLGDVNRTDWVHVLARRALEGYDTSAPAARWLAAVDSEVAYALPIHGGYVVHKPDGALFLYGAMPESLATPALATVAADAAHPGRLAALWVLLQQATPEADRALAAVPLAGLPDHAQQAVRARVAHAPLPALPKPKLTRARLLPVFERLAAGDYAPFDSLVDAAPRSDHDAAQVLLPADLPLLRRARRTYAAAGTPEAEEYYADFTAIIDRVERRATR